MSGRFSRLERWQQLIAGLAGAIATVLAVLLPILLTRSSGSSPTPSTPSTASSAGAGTPATLSPTTSPKPSAGPPAVLYTTKRDLAATYAAHLDNPSWAVASVSSQPAGADIYLDGSGGLTRYNGDWGILTSPGSNGYQECADFTAFEASTVPAASLGVGTRLCCTDAVPTVR